MSSLPAPGAVAQEARSTDLIRRWVEGQRRTLESLDTFSARVTVRHSVETAAAPRVAFYAADLVFNLPEDGPPDAPGRNRIDRPDPPRRGEAARPPAVEGPDAPGPDVDIRLLWMTLDGDTLETIHARRVLQRLRLMLRPDLTRLLDEVGTPVGHLARLQPDRGPVPDRIEGRSALRVDASPAGPMRRSRISLWFDEFGDRLIATRIVISLPGDRRLTAFTRYESVGGLDLPNVRTVTGSVPVPRRGRFVTVLLDHRTRFDRYEFRFKDG